MSCQSFLDGSAGRWSSADRMSRRARVPALSVICSAGSQRFRMATQLLETPEVVLALLGAYRRLLVLLFLQKGHGALQALRRVRIRLGVLAKDISIAPQPAPSRDDIVRRLLGRGELLQLSGQRFQPCCRRLRKQAATLAILERPAGVLEPAGQRRGIL